MLHFDEYFSLFISGLCVAMAIGLFAKPFTTRTILLSLALLSIGYVQFKSTLIFAKLEFHLPHLLHTQVPFGYSIAPFLYLYVRSFVQQKQAFKPADLLHFVPPFIATLIVLPSFMLSTQEKLAIINSQYQNFSFLSILASTSMIIFIAYTILLIVKLRAVLHRENPLHAKLLRLFLLFFSWIGLLILKIIGMTFDLEHVERATNFLFSIELFIFYLALQKMPTVLSHGTLTEEKTKNRGRQVLDSLDLQTLRNDLEIMMEEEKLFCDEDMSLTRLAHALEISPHQLSAFLNDHFQKNFNAFINSYRIAHAKELLTNDPEASTLSVAFASGFNSYSSFFTVFKKEVGIPPGAFKQKQAPTP